MADKPPKSETKNPGQQMVSLVNFATKAALLDDIELRMQQQRGFTIATLNLDHIVKLRRLPAFRAAYKAHSHVVADGNPIVWLRRVMGRPVELIPGSDLVKPIAALASKNQVPVALLGATEQALAMASAQLKQMFGQLDIVATISPPFGLEPEGKDADAAIDQVARSGARLCFLALGAPKQELLAIRAVEKIPNCGFVSIGAGLDFIAGTQERAPLWVQKIAMEWLWRLGSNPTRLFKRYAECFYVLPGLFVSAYTTRSK
ncbi:UDP-N-acetyl-D-mannosaminuronic acid transferase [Roseovarius litorisediminis]|uniref:UDP-N-acetyl-D-mannosaminuronic acid transferase n=1 Tax=Roseovarius litorisediminis TaxID=1312363 RepID=A0A1Y5TNB2_9RHOB|nr:WecB/TagA/CpsF family glycosyltransferase [Roseovarius litorisediminis]SLN68017.1 UDP-N-acetyl-D-mannosaminuronic acid transferase [Roseovarius litorisediminis]